MKRSRSQPSADAGTHIPRSPELPFICAHGDPRCEDDPCPAGIQWLCNAPADHPARATALVPGPKSDSAGGH